MIISSLSKLLHLTQSIFRVAFVVMFSSSVWAMEDHSDEEPPSKMAIVDINKQAFFYATVDSSLNSIKLFTIKKEQDSFKTTNFKSIKLKENETIISLDAKALPVEMVYVIVFGTQIITNQSADYKLHAVYCNTKNKKRKKYVLDIKNAAMELEADCTGEKVMVKISGYQQSIKCLLPVLNEVLDKIKQK